MRAIIVRQHGGAESAQLGDAPEPVAGPGELLIDVRAVAVNFVDTLVISGGYQFLPPLPFIPGKCPAGVVVGAGTRVLALAEAGGYAERVACRAELCFRLPDAMSFTEAASFSLVYDTSWFALRDRARIVQGETVLVLGASGGVGFASVQLAKAMGARVLAGVARMEKAPSVLAAGADVVIDLAAPNLRESLREQVYAATDGAGADIILDPVGGDVFDAAIRALAWRGRMVVIGFAAGRIPTIKANYLLVKNIEVSGLQVSDYRKRRLDQLIACYYELFDLWSIGKLQPPVIEEFPLAEAATALSRVETRAAKGRVVLVPSGLHG